MVSKDTPVEAARQSVVVAEGTSFQRSGECVASLGRTGLPILAA
jgi:hypothetical protein